jgi:TonB family protein
VSAGQNIGQKFIDGGVKLTSAANCGLPSNLTQNASEGSQVMIFVQIDQNGRVSGGRHLSGDAGVGNAVVEVAQQSWQFNPPKVNGTAVKTSAAVTVKF